MTINEPVADGIIDESVQQGNTGDCWLLSAILALNSSETGKKIIKNSIQVQDNNDVTVTFNGLKYNNDNVVSYTISQNEILGNLYSGKYSKGDVDLLVLELAANKLEHDIYMQNLNPEEETENSEPRIVFPENIPPQITDSASGSIDGGHAERILFFLTGIVPEVKKADIREIIVSDGTCFSGLSFPQIANTLVKCATQKADYAITFTLNPDIDNITRESFGWCSIHKRIDLNRRLFTLYLPLNVKFENDVPEIDTTKPIIGHSLYVTNIDIDNRTVTFANPQNSDEEYTFSWNGFFNMGIFSMTSLSLPEITESEEK